MQRFVSQGSRVATRIIPNAAVHAPTGQPLQHPPQAPEGSTVLSATHIDANEDLEDWDFVQQPVSSTEVADALGDLTASRPTRARSEGNWSSSSDITDGSSINELFAHSEYNIYHTAREQINDIVANVLNDNIAGPAICAALARDHAFRDMIDRYAPGTALPAPAQVLTLPGPIGWSEEGPRHQGQTNSNPLDVALEKIVAAIVNAVCHLGNSVRRLPEDISILLSGLTAHINASNAAAVSSSSSGPARGSGTMLQDEDFHHRWEAAFKRVITTVAVAVVARRVVLKTLF